ncbi:MAG: small multi-drug export protein [Deltaproteobacteria bacterium]|nr:small multi-drug export protein [Deltaproteobacteria bacterium]
MLKSIFLLTAITLIPALELRASIPWGIFKMENDISWPVVVAICSIANIILGWIVFWIMGPAFTIIRKWKWFDTTFWPHLAKTQHKIHPYVEKYGELGVALFIGIPLPGSGVYTGAFGSYLLGLDKRKFAIANVIGVLIAATAVTALCLLISQGLVGENSWVAKLFIKK